MKRVLLLLLVVCVLGACATAHPVKTENGQTIMVREAGDFLDQPVTIGGYLALTGVALAVQLALIISARRT